MLFLLTIVINALARLLIIATTRRGSAASMTLRNRWRKNLSYVMLSLTGVCAVVAVSMLFLILGYLVYNGWRSVDWNFFTKLPKPPGETGGGMANAIVGSVEIILLATLIGLPVGFMAGVYLSEFGGKTLRASWCATWPIC